MNIYNVKLILQNHVITFENVFIVSVFIQPNSIQLKASIFYSKGRGGVNHCVFRESIKRSNFNIKSGNIKSFRF